MGIRPQGLQKQRIMDRLKDQDDVDIIGIAYAGTPVDGTTGAGIAGPGCQCTDTTNAELYQNIGTKASPVWTLISNTGTTS